MTEESEPHQVEAPCLCLFCDKCAWYERREGIRRWWVRWYNCFETMGPFTLYTPWWESGFTMEEPERQIMVALIKAKSEDEAKGIIYDAYDERPDDIEFSFVDEIEPTWKPNDRFPLATWMRKYWARLRYENKE